MLVNQPANFNLVRFLSNFGRILGLYVCGIITRQVLTDWTCGDLWCDVAHLAITMIFRALTRVMLARYCTMITFQYSKVSTMGECDWCVLPSQHTHDCYIKYFHLAAIILLSSFHFNLDLAKDIKFQISPWNMKASNFRAGGWTNPSPEGSSLRST